MADITNRADQNRGPATHRAGGDEAGRIELAVEFIKYGSVPPTGERREAARLSGLPAAEAPPGVARPCSVVDGTTRSLRLTHRNRKFVDSPLEGRVRCELVSELKFRSSQKIRFSEVLG